MARKLTEGRFGFSDVNIGDRITTSNTQVSAETIDAFAGLTGDRFEIHMSEAAAAKHGFRGRVAHGLLVLSMVDGLKNQTPAQFKSVASLRWDWSFRAPVLAGDWISAELIVAEKRLTRNPERGILKLDFKVTNQSGTVVQDGYNLLMVLA